MPLPKDLPAVPQRSGGGSNGEGQRRRSGSSEGGGGGAGKVVANRYQVDRKLGSGAFGTAYLVADLKSRKDDKVLKQIGVGDLHPDETVDAVREARLLAKLDHPHIVKFHDSFMSRDHFCIVTEYCEGGDLDVKIMQWKELGRQFEESLIVDWFIQITTAVRYIHDRRILHRDLKSRNIFVKSNLVKLGDFGISRILMGTSDFATTFTGTPYYMSPEVLKHDGYNAKSDIWSLGCILYELCTLQHAFKGQNLMAVMYKIVEGDSPRLPDHFHPQLRALFTRMLERKPTKRPSAVEILQEPFIHQKMQMLYGKMASNSHSSLLKEANDIAKALSPVKKSSLLTEQDEKVLTPKEKMAQRKKIRADMEAEKLKQEISQNYKERRKRFNEHKKKQTKVVPPWVEEHPDVFSDPEFSVTRLSDSSDLSLLTEASSHASFTDGGGAINDLEVPVKRHEAWSTGIVATPTDRDLPGARMGSNSSDIGMEEESQTDMSLGGGSEEVWSPVHPGAGGGRKGGGASGWWEGEDDVPEDPQLAESHYSQFEDFESLSSEEENELDAVLECIEDALELSSSNFTSLAAADATPPPHPIHDEISPFSPVAREKKIANLRRQCVAIYGEVVFEKLHDFICQARYSAEGGMASEDTIMAGLKAIAPPTNVRDCFLVDQLVFLEKQKEGAGP